MDIQPTVVWACRAWFAATFPLGLVRELERRLSATIKRMWAACTCIDDMIVHPAARGWMGGAAHLHLPNEWHIMC